MPLDASAHSEYVVYFYLKYIHSPHNQVHVCYVAEGHRNSTREAGDAQTPKKWWPCFPWRSFDKVVVRDVGPSPGVLAELERRDKLNYHNMKNFVRKLFVTNNVLYDIRYLTGDDPATVIISFRKEMRGTLIVIGSRGEGAFKRHIFGSVSEEVLRNSLVPVLVVKKPQGVLSATKLPDQATTIH
ncbi:hypothetical protein BsWGS_28082 [Bradybaena similaris]